MSVTLYFDKLTVQIMNEFQYITKETDDPKIKMQYCASNIQYTLDKLPLIYYFLKLRLPKISDSLSSQSSSGVIS